MKLIVGLGNPGLEYERTRHNAGFLAVDALRERHARGAVPRARFQAEVIETSFETGPSTGERVMLMKPLTYMNRSGQAVAEAVRFYKINIGAELLVVTDDIHLPCGAIRLRASGGAGGHNGLSDIQRALGSEVWSRCRIGVDAPGLVNQADYVLGRFTAEQWALAGPAVKAAADAAELWARRGVQAAMNKFNVKDTGPGPGPEAPSRPAASDN